MYYNECIDRIGENAMRPKSYTDTQLIEAANLLIAEGKAVNGASLRKKVGSGRPDALLSDYERLSQSGQITILIPSESESNDVVHQELPPEIADRLNVFLADITEMVESINDHAHHTVEGRLNTAIAEANTRASEAAKREAESLQEQEKAFDELEDTLDKLADVEAQYQKLQDKTNQIVSDLKVSQSETRSALADIQERDQLIEKLESELQTHRLALGEAQTATAMAQGQAATLETQNTELKSLLDSEREHLKQTEITNGQLTSNINTLEQQVSKLTARTEQAQNSLQTSEKALAKQQADNQSLVDEVSRLKESLEEKRSENNQLQQTVGEANTTAKLLKERLEDETKAHKADLQALRALEKQHAKLEAQHQDNKNIKS
ncbi:hypothetical protein [Vibrio sp. WXL103]|uniref:hypothetical protein n=1 Tax=Vibrio sp. WXL103 TaxID=3450710 RepID=UPI003EC62AA5